MYSNKIIILIECYGFSVSYRENYQNLTINDSSIISLTINRNMYEIYYQLYIQNILNFSESPFIDSTSKNRQVKLNYIQL
jgi:hypothetical protein